MHALQLDSCLLFLPRSTAGGLFNGREDLRVRWALTLLDHAMTVLRDEYAGRGKELVLNALKGYVGIGENTAEASYEEAAKRKRQFGSAQQGKIQRALEAQKCRAAFSSLGDVTTEMSIPDSAKQAIRITAL
jgi:hypothetical protein